MSELTDALALANTILDRPSADPDDDLAMLSRQLIRQHETVEELRKVGITDTEKHVIEGLNAALRAWYTLPEKHPSDVADFVFHIHALQSMVAFHVARRVNPEFWWSPKGAKT